MNVDESRGRGHWPSLLAAFLYFDASLMVWVLLGALGNALSDAFGLTPGQKGLMVAVPILAGVSLRLFAGMLADRFGERRLALAGMIFCVVPLLLGWFWVSSFAQLLVVGLLLGVAGASFAVALPLAGRWYPAEQQGFILGLVGLGNSGAAVALLLAPQFVPLVGWRGVFGLALIPVVLVLGVVAALAKDAPVGSPPRAMRETLKVLGRADAYWFSLFYAITFGGFLGITSFLTIFFRDQYQVDPIRSGVLATFCVLTGSLVRPIGGLLADRFGGTSVLFLTYLGLGAVGLRMSYVPHLEVALVALILLLALLGIGNGAVFQMIPQRFPDQMGTVTGLVGALGGLGGFVLPVLLGYSREYLGRFGPAFFTLGLSGFVAAGLVLQVSRQWQSRDGLSALPTAAPRREIEVMAGS